MWYRYNRRGSRGMRYLWFLFIPLFFFSGHTFFGILLSIAVIVVLSLIGRAIFSVLAASSTTQNQWYQPRQQQPYQQNQYQQPYQPNQYQQPYQSYGQGYQQPYYQPRPSEASQPSEQYQAPQQPQYDSYEQPRAEYPQELPPMQQ